jgi:hypothetical protein
MTPTNEPTEFQRFQSLARRILTTPKAELLKHAPKKASKRTTTKKRK